MKYLKYFEQASAYEAYKNESDYVTPNVSYIAEIDGVIYTIGKQEAKQITFTLSISSTFVDFGERTFTCNEGDTWADLAAKDENFSISEIDGSVYYTDENGEFSIDKDMPEVNAAHGYEVIEDGKTYYAFRGGWV